MPKKILKNGPEIPIVFLHGFLGTPLDFEKVCSYLPPCLCIGYDLPGHADASLDPLEIDLPQFHLVGYSMGGRIALHHFRKKATTLTLLSTHPGLKSEEEKQKRWEHDQMWAKMLLELPIDEFLHRWYEQPIFVPFKPDLTMRKQHDVKKLSASLLQFSLSLQPRFEVDGILVGERDEKFKTVCQNPIFIPQAGHMLHLENPKAVAAHLQQRLGL